MSIGPYEIVSALGVGGMGEVYRANDSNLKRQVALKVLPPEVAAYPERVARFQREAELLAALNHPNIAHLYGVERSGTSFALVMELVEGPTLADRIAEGPLDLEEALPIARQVAEALEAAHEQGIIHRDLKPANIKVRADGTVKVLDFGLAKALEFAPALRSSGTMSNSPTITSPALMTGVGMLLGTAAYMSPEQAKGRPADKRSDIWAFGVVLYEVLTGARLFEGPTVTETLAQVLTKAPDLSLLPRATPLSVKRLLRRCFEREPRKRLPDAADIRLEIDEAQNSPDAVPATSQTNRSWLWMGVAAVVAGLVAFGVGRLSGRPSNETGSAESESLKFDIGLPDNVGFSASAGGSVPEIAISPDGRSIAFVGRSTSTGETQLMVRRLDETEVRPLAGTSGATGPFWSPDSDELAFLASNQIRSVPASGAGARLIGAIPSNLGVAVSGASWGRAGTIILGNRTPNAGNGLLRVDVSGGGVTVLTKCGDGCLDSILPSFLPDGRRFVFSRAGSSPGIYLGSLDSPDQTQILPDFGHVIPSGNMLFAFLGSTPTLFAYPFDSTRAVVLGRPTTVTDQLAFSAQARRAAFSVSQNGTLVTSSFSGATGRLRWVARDGRPGEAVSDPGSLSTMRLAPDGRRVVFGRRDTRVGGQSLWVHDLPRGTSTRLTFSSGSADSDGSWSPDGGRIAYASVRGNGKRIYTVSSSGGVEKMISSESGVPNHSVDDWSPDGRFILYHLDASRELWARPMESSEKAFLVYKPATGRIDQGAFSPDGRWVAFNSEESGRSEVYVTAFPTSGERWQVSSTGGVQPRWRRDGRELFFLTPDGAMTSVEVKPKGAQLDFGPPQMLFKSGVVPNFGTEQYDVTADGQRFLMMLPQGALGARPRDSMTVWVNWVAALRNGKGQ